MSLEADFRLHVIVIDGEGVREVARCSDPLVALALIDDGLDGIGIVTDCDEWTEVDGRGCPRWCPQCQAAHVCVEVDRIGVCPECGWRHQLPEHVERTRH